MNYIKIILIISILIEFHCINDNETKNKEALKRSLFCLSISNSLVNKENSNSKQRDELFNYSLICFNNLINETKK